MTSGEKERVFNLLGDIQDLLEDGFRRERRIPSFMDDTPDDNPECHSVSSGPPPVPGDTGEKIAAEIACCRKCRLHANRQFPPSDCVSGDPEVLAVSEAPESGDCCSLPQLSGPKGQLLEKMLQAIGLSRANCHVTTAVKCPTPGGRDPLPDELRACAVYLERQIALMRPRFLLATGKSSLHGLRGAEDGALPARGELGERDGVRVLVTCSLQDLLKDPAMKRLAWQDLKLLKDALDG